MAVLPGVAVTVGKGLTFIVVVPVLIQPAALVPVIVYVAVAVPEKVTGVPVDVLRFTDGDQEYVEAPDAAIVVLAPIHIEALPGVAITVGSGLTTTCVVPLVKLPVVLQVPEPVQVVTQ